MPSVAEAQPRAVGTLRKRFVTAFTLGPAVMLAVLLLPTPWFALALAAIVLTGAWEWAGLAGVTARGGRAAYAALIGLALTLAWLVFPRAWDLALLVPAALWWLWLAATLGRVREIPHVTGPEPPLLLVGLLVLAAPWIALTHLHAEGGRGPALVLALLMMIWFADSAAYFVGRRFGRRKLAPVLSPGKTWAGVWGALAVAALWGLAVGLALGLGARALPLLVLIFALTAAVSIVGDLYESLLKRRRGLKDAGRLLPGHGGMLDRIDSTTAAAPLFTLGLLWLLAAG